MRILILGAGVGKAVGLLSSRDDSVRKLVLADGDFERAQEACHAINRLRPHVLCTPKLWDARNLNGISFKKFDVVISALPARFNLEVARKAINEGVHFCDLGGVVSITEKMIAELGQKAERNGLSVVPDCGVMPGLGIMLSRVLVDEFDKGASICVYVGGIPQKPKAPLNYQEIYNRSGLKSICCDDAFVLENGRIVVKEPFSELEELYIEELASYSPNGDGLVEAFISAGASTAHETFQKLGVKDFCEKTIRWEGFVRLLKGVPADQFKARIDELMTTRTDSENPDLLWMKVLVAGSIQGEKAVRTATLFDRFDRRTGLTAMERSTGFPTAISARYLADNSARSGVLTPENVFSVGQLRQIITELNKSLNIIFE